MSAEASDFTQHDNTPHASAHQAQPEPAEDQGPPFDHAELYPAELPQIIDRLLDALRGGLEIPDGEKEIVFEGIELQCAEQAWIGGLSSYSHDEALALAAAEASAPKRGRRAARGRVDYGADAVAWSTMARDALVEAWGDPMPRTVRTVGEQHDPEGIVDVLMLSIGADEAEMWDRGDLFLLLFTQWLGEQAASDMRQVFVVLPRDMAIGGMAAMIGDEATAHPLLMHGESLTELRRRAWIMSTLYDVGEVRVREAAIEATRMSLQRRDGTTTVWTFADDGRALVLIDDPNCEYAKSAATHFARDHGLLTDPNTDAEPVDGTPGAEPAGGADADETRAAIAEARLILNGRLLGGIPRDLLDSVAAPAVRGDGEAAEHALAFAVQGDQAMPLVSGAFWFDGETWRTSRGIMEIGHREGFGLDDFGRRDALRRPYRLGGEVTVDAFVPPAREAADGAAGGAGGGASDGAAAGAATAEAPEVAERRRVIAQVFAACPYPEQPRPEGDARLGYAIPTDTTPTELIDDIERAAEAWWLQSPDEMPWADPTFTVGGRPLSLASDGTELTTVLAQAELWNSEELQAWFDRHVALMSERWGQAYSISAEDPRTGEEVRTPITRLLRGMGIEMAPMWWVHGHAVTLIAGRPHASYGDEAEAVLVIGRPDSVVQLMRGTWIGDVRHRLRGIANLEALAGGPAVGGAVPWAGPALRGSDLVPDAVHGELRVGDIRWRWAFTHDQRAVLASYRVDLGAADAEAAAGPTAGATGTVEGVDIAVAAAGDSPWLESGAGAPVGDPAATGIEPDAASAVSAAAVVGATSPAELAAGTAGAAGAGVASAADAGAGAGTEDAVDHFAGVPDDLRSLFDRDPAQQHAPEPTAARPLAVFWFDGAYWWASDAMVRGARADDLSFNPLADLYGPETGVPQLQWALRAGEYFAYDALADVQFSSFVLDTVVEPAQARQAFAQLGTPLEAARTKSLNDLLDVVTDAPEWRFLLDAALSNTDPRSRREIALWLLARRGFSAEAQLSALTPLGVLFDNPSLDAGDAVLVRRLREQGADVRAGAGTASVSGDLLVQLCARDLAEADILPLVDALLEDVDDDTTRDDAGNVRPERARRIDVSGALALLEAGELAHAQSRGVVLERLRAVASQRG